MEDFLKLITGVIFLSGGLIVYAVIVVGIHKLLKHFRPNPYKVNGVAYDVLEADYWIMALIAPVFVPAILLVLGLTCWRIGACFWVL
jgi:hypothetical protein